MKKVLFLPVLLTMVFSLAFTSCNKDDDEDNSIPLTEENVLGTWENTEEGVTLLVVEEGGATYTSADYPDGKACSWYISKWGWLDVSAGLFVKTFTMPAENQLKDGSTGIILTKK